MGEVGDSDRQLAAWADEVVARLDAQADLDGDLLAALGSSPSLREETLSRMAEAVRAAALGLGPAGCAAAAGISERLLLSWQAQEPSFAGAMAGASALARSYFSGDNGRPPSLTPVKLHVLLKGIRAGARIPPAAAVVGVSTRTLNRVRRDRPRVNALILAARRARPRRADRRGGSAYEKGYRLVHVDIPSADDAPSKG